MGYGRLFSASREGGVLAEATCPQKNPRSVHQQQDCQKIPAGRGVHLCTEPVGCPVLILQQRPDGTRQQRSGTCSACSLPWQKELHFIGSDQGDERSALLYGLSGMCCLNGIVLKAYQRHILIVMPESPSSRVDELLPWEMVMPAPST